VNCPRCNTTNISGERRHVLGDLLEIYRACNVCGLEMRERMSTVEIERHRQILSRWRAAEHRHGSGGVSSEQILAQHALLRNVAARAGLLDQVPECQQPLS
jgi:hypothetical protein